MTNEPKHDPNERPELDSTPPILGSWRNIYLLVFAILVLQVLLYNWITRAYS